MKTLKTILGAAVFVLLGVRISTATPPRRPALEIKGKIQIEGNIKPGELITITFNFALIPEGQAYERMKYYFGDSNKTCESQFSGKDDFYSSRYDTAYIAAGDGLEFITPNSWRGHLKPNKTESITAKAILKSQSQIDITGIVGSFCGISLIDNQRSQSDCDFFNTVTSEVLNPGSTSVSDTASFDTIRLGPEDSILIRNVINNTPPPDSHIIIKTLPTPPPRKSNETRQLNNLPLQHRIDSYISNRSFYLVSGQFQNVNPPHDTVPSVDTYGYMLYYDDEWYFDSYVNMDANGYFSVYSDHPHIIIINNPVNIAARVFSTSDHQLNDGADIVYYNFGFELNNPGMIDCPIPIEYTTNNIIPGAFYIAEIIRLRYHNIFDMIGDMPDPIYIFWDSLNSQYSTSSFGAYEVNGIPIIYICHKYGSLKFIDEWDISVISHEYAHYLVWWFAGFSPYAFGEHEFIFPPAHVLIGGIRNRIPDLVFNEALANALQGFLRFSPVYSDTTANYALYTANFERPLPDAPYVVNHNPPSSAVPYYEGAHVEGAVLAALWDLYDNIDDGDYYIGGTQYGTNDDYNGGTYWYGFDYIWNVLTSFDPQPNNPDHNNCWNIYEFIHGWRKMGYPVDAVFTDIFEAHNVPVFLPGDINDDGRIDVLDIIQFIDWKYKGQPWPPVHCPSADVNADCEINIVDVLYLVDYKFKNGEEPLAGCYENPYWPQTCN